MLAGVCVVSASFHGVALVLAGGLGQGCHPDGNFSELLSAVIDDQTTWGGAHLLGQALLGNASYPLTFRSVIDSCRLNRSLYEALELGCVFNLEEDIYIAAADMVRGW